MTFYLHTPVKKHMGEDYRLKSHKEMIQSKGKSVKCMTIIKFTKKCWCLHISQHYSQRPITLPGADQDKETKA